MSEYKVKDSEMESHVWKVIKNFTENIGMVPQIESFNWFTMFGIRRIIENVTIKIPLKNGEYIIEFGDVYIPKACMSDSNRKLFNPTPFESRTMNLFYDSPVHVDITETTIIDGKVIESVKNFRTLLARIPIMVKSSLCNLTDMSDSDRIKSGECENDTGGYFIVKGHERVIVSQLRNAYNRITVTRGRNKQSKLISMLAEMRSMSEETGHSVLISASISLDKRHVFFNIPCIKSPIPAGIVFKAMGFNPEDIRNFLGTDCRYSKIVERDNRIYSKPEDAQEYIGRYSFHVIAKERQQKYAWQVVESELFPHMGITATLTEKAVMLCSILRKLFLTLCGKRVLDNIDAYMNKRVDDCGILMYDLFRNLFKKMVSGITKKLSDTKVRRPNVMSVISSLSGCITKDLRKCFLTGNWGVPGNSYVRPGVSQILTRLSYSASVSHKRRVVFPIGKEGKNMGIRAINPSQYGFVCPNETPEGGKVGIVLNLSYMARISIHTPTVFIKEIIENSKLVVSIGDTPNDEICENTIVFLNGCIIGLTDSPEELNELFQGYKGTVFGKEISVSYNALDNELYVYSDGGRFIRAVFTSSEDGNLNMKIEDGCDWKSLVKKSLIKWIDPYEQENKYFGMYWKQTGVDFHEIHPVMMLGVLAASIPWPDHSPSPRNTYQCAMGKQAMGLFARSYNVRTDTMSHLLHNPQKPIVATNASRILKVDEMPSSINCVVAIMSLNGYNQEDSILMNKAAVDRGMFVATSRRTICREERKLNATQTETIMVPPVSIRKANIDYSLLDSSGVVRKGTIVKKNDIIIGMVLARRTRQKGVGKQIKEHLSDCSIRVKKAEEGIVERIIDIRTPGGYRMIKIIITHHRIPEVGDKFASRSAQKGTVGMIVRHEDMPFTSDGIVPDIVMNAHAIPSRMTINQLIESVLGKASAIKGEYGDCSPWKNIRERQSVWSKRNEVIESVTNKMASAGLERHGYETMMSGLTGETFDAQIFIGVVAYQRLKHNVSSKIHARSQGHVNNLTRQPREGRSRDGGLRFGEMERDCMIVHGASEFLKERLFKCSDPFQINVCRECGNTAANIKKCTVCSSNKIVDVHIPFAAKLLFQELKAMSIRIAIKPST